MSIDLTLINSENSDTLQHAISKTVTKELSEFDKSQSFEHNLIKSDIGKLAQQSTDIEHQLNKLTDLVDNLQNMSSEHSPNAFSIKSEAVASDQAPPTKKFLKAKIENPTTHINKVHQEFIGSDLSEELVEYFKSSKFKQENGHSVISFGEFIHM